MSTEWIHAVVSTPTRLESDFRDTHGLTVDPGNIGVALSESVVIEGTPDQLRDYVSRLVLAIATTEAVVEHDHRLAHPFTPKPDDDGAYANYCWHLRDDADPDDDELDRRCGWERADHAFAEEDVAFFREHAGWSYNPATETPEEGKRRGAERLARAEAEGKRRGWTVVWNVDPDAMWDDDVERESTDYSQYIATLLDEDGLIAGSLGSVDFGPTDAPESEPYARVVAAELTLDAFTQNGE